MNRRIYPLKLNINGRRLQSVVIDPHYEEKHADSLTDEIILALVKQLDGGFFQSVARDENGFKYFVDDMLVLESKFYKLIWLLHDDGLYIGIVNAYRR